MSDLNQCQFTGNVGRNPEIRSTPSGDQVANLSMAVNDTWRDKSSGEKREHTEWVRIVIWGPLVKVVENYVKKGDKLFVSGKQRTRKFTDQSGAERYSTEVVLQGPQSQLLMLGGGKSEIGGGGYSEPNPDAPKEDFRNADLQDDIPFLTMRSIW